jgi:hypothetical protein
LKVARAELDVVSKKEGVTEVEVAEATQKVTRAQRDAELASLRLAAAQETVAAAQDRVRATVDKQAAALARDAAALKDTGNSAKAATPPTQSLLVSLLALAPALVPVAGAAAAAGGAFVALGVAGVLAVKGIQAEMKSGSQIGAEYAGQVQVAKNALTELQGTAAKNFFSGFQSSVSKLNAELPAFNNTVAASSSTLGDIASHLSGAVVGGFNTFAPVIQKVETGIDGLAARFEKFATGPNGAKFAATLGQDFEQVVPLITELAVAFEHLIVAAAPVGGAVITTITNLTHAINAIPVPVLTALVVALSTVGSARLVGSLGAKLGVVSAEARAAGASAGLLGRGFAAVVPTLGVILGAQVGFKSLDNATSSWATSTNDLQYNLHSTAHAMGDLLSGNFSSALSDLFGGNRAKSDAARDNYNNLNKSLSSLIPTTEKVSAGFTAAFGTKATKEIEQAQKHIVALNKAALSQKVTDYVGLEKGSGGNVGGSITTTGNAQVVSKLTRAQQIASEEAKVYKTNLAALNVELTNFQTAAARSSSITSLAAAYSSQASAIDKVDSKLKDQITAGKATDKSWRGVTIGATAYAAALQMFGGNSEKATGFLKGQIDSLLAGQGATKDLTAESLRLGAATGEAAAKFKLTADQVDLYAEAAGISSTAVARGTITAAQFTAEIGQVAGVVSDGNTALTGFVSAVDAFNKSGKTAADRGQLLGAALVAFNGDALSYANTMVGAATANQQLVTDFKNLKSGVLDLKTGTIDYHNAAAGPLLNDLQGLQTAAENAASATYQHEVATKGAKQAAADAASTYKSDTYTALVSEAQQLGLTAGEAKKLGKNYFDLPKNVVTRIQQLGGNTTNTLLSQISQVLQYISGRHWNFNVHANTSAASAAIADLKRQLNSIPSSMVVAIGSQNKRIAEGGNPGRAANGMIVTAGTGPRADDVPILVSKGEAVIPAHQVAKHRAVVQGLISGMAGYASGGVVGGPGGFTGVDYSGNANKNGVDSKSSSSSSKAKKAVEATVEGTVYESIRAAMNAAKRDLKANIKLGASIDGSGLAAFRKAVKGTANQAETAFASIYTKLQKLGLSKGQSTALRDEEKKLTAAITARNKATDALNTTLAAQKELESSIKQATTGSFDITTAGAGADSSSAVTFGSIYADALQQDYKAKAYNTNLTSLSAKGLNLSETEQLAQAGPAALAQVMGLNQGSASDIASLNSVFGDIGKQGSQLATLVGNRAYAGKIATEKATVTLDDKSVKMFADTEQRIVRAIVRGDEGKPINIYVDKQVIARVTQRGTSKNSRRK